mmetsp:Transcript_24047/g.27706  ORF Transcript_24047/g.27706 Transcript_24047/m.27706 type:complete len:205 (+) Transcript_24047:321-935(+)
MGMVIPQVSSFLCQRSRLPHLINLIAAIRWHHCSIYKKKYPRRVREVKGNSCKTLPSYNRGEIPLNRNCDFLHGSSLCSSDNIDLIEGSECGTILTSTAMTSIKDGVVYFGSKKGQWEILRNRECISNITCFAEDEHILEKDYVFGKRGTVMHHEFCFAINNGKCSKKGDSEYKKNCESKMTAGGIAFESLCQKAQVLSPLPFL